MLTIAEALTSGRAASAVSGAALAGVLNVLLRALRKAARPTIVFAPLVLIGCLSQRAEGDASCVSGMLPSQERMSPTVVQRLPDWASLWNHSLSFGVSDRPGGQPVSQFVPDSVMEALARDSVAGMWSLAYVVANERISGLTVAANAAQFYAERRGPARPMLTMLHDFRPAPHRLALGLAAIRTPLDSIDSVAVRGISCELGLQDTLPLPRGSDWEWFPASQWAGGLHEVRREIWRLLPE